MLTKWYLSLWLIVLLAACAGETVVIEETAPANEPTTVAPTAVPVEAPAPGRPGDASAGSPRDYVIVQDASQVRFTLDEVLRGSPTTVVGSSNQISGDVALDFSQPAAAQISPIVIDAASLVTDQGMRNRTINRFILVTSSYPTITFTPTGLSGLPDSVTIGEPISFTINGDLSITNITLPVQFQATVTAVSDTRLEGNASTTIQRTDFGLTIPNVPGVANVAEDILLELDFVAEAN